MESTQQVIVIRRTAKSTRTPPNTPRQRGEKQRAQRDGSSRFLARFRLTPASSPESADPTVRNTLPELAHGPASQPARGSQPRRARTVDSNAGSPPGWSLFASMLQGSPTAGGLQRAISSALAGAGDAAQFIREADDCLGQAVELSGQGPLDVATRCRLGDLLHHCRVMQELLVTDEPDPLTDVISGLLGVAEFDPRQQGPAKLAAAQQILGRIERRAEPGDAFVKARSKVRELTAKVDGQKTQRVCAALHCWGMTRRAIDACLRDDDTRQAFIRAFDAAALQAKFEHRPDQTPRVVGFAPILAASSADVAAMASALIARGQCPLALHLLAGHVLERTIVGEDDDAFELPLRLCATLWRQLGEDDPAERTLVRIAQHVRLLIDCGLIRGERQSRSATHLLEEISLPSLDRRLMRLDDVASVCRVFRSTAAADGLFRCAPTLLRVAADVAMDCPGWGHDAIERAVRQRDQADSGQWHSRFVAHLRDRRDRALQIEQACSKLLADDFPFTVVRSEGSSALCWESDVAHRRLPFDWEAHGAAFVAFAEARLDQSPELDPVEMQQWFDILCIDCRPKQISDRVRLLALATRAIGRSKDLLDGPTMRHGLERLASEPGTVSGALALCGLDAFQLCVELASHPQIEPVSNLIRLQSHMMRSRVFIAMVASVSGSQVLDDLLARAASDPALLKRRPMRELLRLLVGSESARPASRKLLQQPLLREALLRPDKESTPAVLECLLLLPQHDRVRRAAEMGFAAPADLNFLFAPGDCGRRAAIERLLGESATDRACAAPRLRIAALGAAMADALAAAAGSGSANPSTAALADALLQLHEAFANAAPTDWRQQAQRLVDAVRLTLRLVHERPGETSLAFFRLFPPLNDPAEAESMVTSQGGRAIESQGRAIRAKGEPGLFAFAALLACLYLIEEEPLPVADSFEAASLARLMCAALWFDAGQGLRCRRQLDQLKQRALHVQHWLLPPSWVGALCNELAEASATLPN
jgi:hypothetical protein